MLEGHQIVGQAIGAAHLQALMLDAVGLVLEALEQLNTAADSDSEEVELDVEKLGSALEAALTFLGNASTQTSNLRHLRLMEDINKELVPPQSIGSKSMPCGRCETTLRHRVFRRLTLNLGRRKYQFGGHHTTRRHSLHQRCRNDSQLGSKIQNIVL